MPQGSDGAGALGRLCSAATAFPRAWGIRKPSLPQASERTEFAASIRGGCGGPSEHFSAYDPYTREKAAPAFLAPMHAWAPLQGQDSVINGCD